MFVRFLIFVSLFCLSTRANSQNYTYDYDASCRAAYSSYLSMDLADGNAATIKAIKQNPYNLMATYISDYEDFVLLLFNGSEIDMQQRKGHFNERLDLLNKGNEDVPWYRLCKAGVYLHWAFIHGRFGENFKAATLFRKSFQLLRENREKFPDFTYNNVFLGLEEAAVGTIPEDYKWLASVFGMKGNVKNGNNKLTTFLKEHTNTTDILREEAVIFQCYIRFYLLSQPDQVWNFVNSNDFQIQNNLLRCFVRTNLSLNNRRAETALQTMHYAQTLSNYNEFPTMDYEMGNALMLKVDYSSINYFQRYVTRNKGNLYTKDAWQKMAYMFYLEQNQSKANYCLSQLKAQGNTIVDADKQAERLAETQKWPNPTLLQVRLLTDGGYFTQAQAKLSGLNETNFNNPADKLEYNYRTGKLFDELNQDAKAIQYYQIALNTGKDMKEQYAARSALQIGMIYEKQGKNDSALQYYRICLQMRNHDFQSSLDQQSKAGINRLSGK
ncbi:tetratricopeptide repeat protein [Taibaiella soli]|uniref:Uncharacterized protein n=1 Tax=Taibaiella soli TaxID=1649169 RepID=A0A2W2BBH8_9BACT|nr:hypothetical protein [Taibaiella soli]PZF73247.1 hypothetical protein DN068_08720 [Taibaiella soli]